MAYRFFMWLGAQCFGVAQALKPPDERAFISRPVLQTGGWFAVACVGCKTILKDEGGINPRFGEFTELEAAAKELGWTGSGMKCKECSE